MTWMLQRAVGRQRAIAMTLLGEVLDAAAAEAASLTMRTVDGDHEQLVEAALELAAPATEAPRELVIATKASMRATAVEPSHEAAVNIEIAPQLESLASPEFAGRLAALPVTH